MNYNRARAESIKTHYAHKNGFRPSQIDAVAHDMATSNTTNKQVQYFRALKQFLDDHGVNTSFIKPKSLKVLSSAIRACITLIDKNELWEEWYAKERENWDE